MVLVPGLFFRWSLSSVFGPLLAEVSQTKDQKIQIWGVYHTFTYTDKHTQFPTFVAQPPAKRTPTVVALHNDSRFLIPAFMTHAFIAHDLLVWESNLINLLMTLLHIRRYATGSSQRPRP
jgi:hypothetical protein